MHVKEAIQAMGQAKDGYTKQRIVNRVKNILRSEETYLLMANLDDIVDYLVLYGRYSKRPHLNDYGLMFNLISHEIKRRLYGYD